MKIAKTLLGMLFSITVAACGGGGGGGGGGSSAPPPSSSTLSGVAAVGYPIVNGTINVTCAGGGPLNTTTNDTGAWQVTISGQTPPCAVEVSGGTINGVANVIAYHSIATSFGTVNVTPLSDLMLAYLLSEATPNVWFAGLNPATLTLITPAKVNAALTTQCTALSGLTPLCATNPITTVFTATRDNIMEYMLIALRSAIINSGVTYSDLLNGAAMPTYTLPVAGFNTALTNAYIATTSSISATANTTAQNLTVGTAVPGFSPLSAMGGAIPYVYSIISGTLPTGLSFNANTGVVSGTPSATYATANLVFSVRDATNVVATTTSTVSFNVSFTMGNWTATGSMVTARSDHPATLLLNGKVLVTGGASNVGIGLTSSELYDPATGLFTATGSMATARRGHTATLLSNGKVLVAGGSGGLGGSGVLASSELYDPATGLFTATGSMATARAYHTATLLPNGKVLVTGGTNNGGVITLASAELYDPTTGLFTATGSMATARTLHTATLLPNGKVLVAGGSNLASAELYDPTTGLFTATGSMATAREQHAGTLLPTGKVLVTGGAVGGNVFFASTELYDPATGLFTSTGSMATAREAHTATLLDNGKVLITGGFNFTTAIASAELYDPATGLFSATGSMATARDAHTATLLPSGKVMVTGGTFLTSAELYQ